MKGFPKVIGTKQDVQNLAEMAQAGTDGIAPADVVEYLNNLLATRQHYTIKAESAEKPAEDLTQDDFELLDSEPRSRMVVAIELKMSNWKRALTQAYKYRAFSHMAIVLMDADRSKAALSNLNSFIKYKIGLATLDQHGTLKVHSLPEALPPFSISMHKRFRDKIGADGCNIKNNLCESAIQIKLSACLQSN